MKIYELFEKAELVYKGEFREFTFCTPGSGWRKGKEREEHYRLPCGRIVEILSRYGGPVEDLVLYNPCDYCDENCEDPLRTR